MTFILVRRRLLQLGSCVAVVLSAAGLAAAAGQEGGGLGGLSQVDSVLDKLERRLLDQEADGLSYGERQNDPAFLHSPERESAPKKRYKFKGTKVEAGASESDKLKAVGRLVSELEAQVDQFASSVQKTKQAVIDDAAIDNFVSIGAQLADTDVAAVKNMTVKLDGYEVYTLNDSAGLWLPSKNLPLYAGPLQPGTHRLDLEVRLVMRASDNLPLNSDVYRFINKTFDLSVGGARSSNRYVVAIKPPAKAGGTPDATLKESL